MIAAALYLLVISAFIRYNGFFGILTDHAISQKTSALLFLVKAAAVPVFYLVYTKVYGGLENFDSGKFFHDVVVLNDCAYNDPASFLRIISGLQDESETSVEYRNCLRRTLMWDNGLDKEYRFNDNRLLLRIHAILHFIAFGSWWVHALLTCFFSFAGLFCIYRCFMEFFRGREKLLLSAICFFPSLWFFTGGFLKEGLTVLVLGLTLLALKQLVREGLRLRSLWLIVLFTLSVILKPYLLITSALTFLLFFLLQKYRPARAVSIFLGLAAIFFLLLNAGMHLWKGHGLLQTGIRHQKMFQGVANGGIFLAHDDVYVQLAHDTSLVKAVTDSVYTIRRGAAFMYWEDSHNQDTLYNSGNQDTLKQYRLVFQNPPSHSNLPVPHYKSPWWTHAFAGLKNSLLTPLFYNAKGGFAFLASLENLLLLSSIAVIIAGMVLKRKARLLPLVVICFVSGLCILTGVTTPNTGAILRYRAPAVIFLLIGTLYYLPVKKERESGSV